MIILGAGLARPQESAHLIKSLLANGDKSQKDRYQLHLLAAACLDTAIGPPHLERLWIGGTDILDYSPLADLVNLQYLTVWGGTVQIKPSLSRLTKLRSLSIWDYGASDLSFLEDLPKLESLLLNGNEITNISALRGLTGLRSLTLWGTRVEDLYPLQSLPILQQLNLDYTKIDPAQVDALKEANPALWVRQTI